MKPAPLALPPGRATRRHSLVCLAALAASPGLLMAPRPAQAQAGLTLLHRFTGGRAGAHPSSLMVHRSGQVFGVAEGGGLGERGLIFRLGMSGYRVVHRFISGEAQAGGAGQGKLSPLVEGPDGELHGTTLDGGNFGKGLAYRLNRLGQAVQWHHFTGGEDDGMSPSEQLVIGPDGAFYGVGIRVVGGWNQVPQVFRLDASGGFSRVAQIGSWLQGPGRLTLAGDGQFYLTSREGGSAGDGGAYRVSPDGQVSLLYSVDMALPTLAPSGGLVLHPDGFLYGTTENDPLNQQLGTVFRMSLDGQVSLLHRFQRSQGARPFGLLLGRDGGLYGVAREGGPLKGGTVYRVDTSGAFRLLHAFEPGWRPVGRLAQAADGQLLGVTQQGPAGTLGTVYSLGPA